MMMILVDNNNSMDLWQCLAISLLLFFSLFGLFYFILDINYFIRMTYYYIFGRFVKSRKQILDTTQITSICLTTDVDTLLVHMNNARYLREIDYARYDFYERTSLLNTIRSKGGSIVIGTTTIRYRRFIRPFTKFYITTKIIYWDNQSIFMEHRFVSPKNGFIYCIAICQSKAPNCSVEDVMFTLMTNRKFDNVESGVILKKPALSLEVSKLIEAYKISSDNLRNGNVC